MKNRAICLILTMLLLVSGVPALSTPTLAIEVPGVDNIDFQADEVTRDTAVLTFKRADGPFKIPVLAYHSIMPQEYYYPINVHNPWILHLDTFYMQMRYLYENGFNTITSEQLLDFLFYDGELPENPIMLTFDDGYLDNALFAAPILRLFGFSGVLFIITSVIEEYTGQMMAYPTRFISKSGIYETSDVFEFASHTHDMHRSVGGVPILKRASFADIRDDIKLSFEAPLTCKISFAFPFGAYSQNSLAALREVGIRLAFTTATGYLTQGSNPLRIPRFVIIGGPEAQCMQEFSRIVSGDWR